MTRRALAALAFAFALAHLPFLPSSLEDIDSVNFALATREFDVGEHRPHPPGYPLYVAVSKAAVTVNGWLQPSAPRSTLEARAMAVLSLAGGVAAILLLYALLAAFTLDEGEALERPWRRFDARALAATALTAASPLFWYMSARPMSDVPGLAAALAALVCLALAWRRQRGEPGDRRLSPAHIEASGRMIVLGSLVAAFAFGFRSQTAVLTVPLLLLVLVDRIGRGAGAALAGSLVAFSVGTAVWAVPMVFATGGLDRYLAALGSQAGEDFAGGEMLYLTPTPRLAAQALLRTFIAPWDSLPLGAVVVTLAIAGAGVLLARERRTVLALTAIGVPYLLFHLLFQDTTFTRYALPLIPIVALLAVRGLEVLARGAALPATGALALWAVAVAAPVLAEYGLDRSPTARAVQALNAAMHNGERPGALAMHQTFRRPLEAEDVRVETRLAAPPRREWLELSRYWREGHTDPLWMLADPRRTDLALVDPVSRADRIDYGWRFVSMAGFGGMRPDAVSWYRMPAPGWFVEEGWALTPETAGIARVSGHGPHLGPITAWVRRRPQAATLLIGGRHLGGPHDPPVRFDITVDGRPLVTWDVSPGFFLRTFDVPAGTFAAGAGALARLTVTSAAPAGARIETSIEQFDVQDTGRLMWGYGDGWHEAEYDPRVGLWRWSSERAVWRVVGEPGTVAVRLLIEAPRRYFDQPARVRLSAGSQTLFDRQTAAGGVIAVTVPADALRASSGEIVLESDRTFVPAETGGPPDRRRLALRVFGVDIQRAP